MTAVAPGTYEADIVVERTEVLKTGRNRVNNRPWTLYRVHATDVDRGPIHDLELRTFDQLPAGEQIRVVFKPTVGDDGALTHYTLKKVRSAEDVRASRSKARAAVMGMPRDDLSRPARMPVEPDAPANGRPPTREEFDALATRMETLEGRFELLLTLIPQPPEESE